MENVTKEEAVEEEVQEKTVAKSEQSAAPIGKMDAIDRTRYNIFLNLTIQHAE